MELRRLSVHWELSFLDLDPHQLIFAFLTHLFIVDGIAYPYHIRLPSFLANYLLVLTHFAMSNSIFFEEPAVAERDVLAICATFQVLIVCPETNYKEDLPSIDDVRLVYMESDLADFEAHWVTRKREE
ncbi:hypothetical protein B0H14DRAFT_3466159 [Mycena olivaceomarginata]|nr:hypothetical protein B0H14DRAFT_3466159 [Mycena olivaceomarginata]